MRWEMSARQLCSMRRSRPLSASPPSIARAKKGTVFSQISERDRRVMAERERRGGKTKQLQRKDNHKKRSCNPFPSLFFFFPPSYPNGGACPGRGDDVTCQRQAWWRNHAKPIWWRNHCRMTYHASAWHGDVCQARRLLSSHNNLNLVSLQSAVRERIFSIYRSASS